MVFIGTTEIKLGKREAAGKSYPHERVDNSLSDKPLTMAKNKEVIHHSYRLESQKIMPGRLTLTFPRLSSRLFVNLTFSNERTCLSSCCPVNGESG